MTRTAITLLREGAKLPEYATAGAAALDCYAAIEAPVTLLPGSTAIIPLGFALAAPQGFKLEVLPRSGLATKGIQIGNSPGTVDSDYRGEVGAIVYNGKHSREGWPYRDAEFTVNPGDRICQIALVRVERIEWDVVSALDETDRGAGGFGSTGV